MKINTDGLEIIEVNLMQNNIINMKCRQLINDELSTFDINLRPTEFMDSFQEVETFEGCGEYTQHYIKMAMCGKYVEKVDLSENSKYMTLREIEKELGHKVYIISEK